MWLPDAGTSVESLHASFIIFQAYQRGLIKDSEYDAYLCSQLKRIIDVFDVDPITMPRKDVSDDPSEYYQ